MANDDEQLERAIEAAREHAVWSFARADEALLRRDMDAYAAHSLAAYMAQSFARRASARKQTTGQTTGDEQ